MSRPVTRQTEIAQMRRAAGIPQKFMAIELGVTPDHLRFVESGLRQSKSLEQRAKDYLRKAG